MLLEDVGVENGKHTYNLMLKYAAGGTLHEFIQKYNKLKMMLGELEAV